jgi:hypothetical protein
MDKAKIADQNQNNKVHRNHTEKILNHEISKNI